MPNLFEYKQQKNQFALTSSTSDDASNELNATSAFEKTPGDLALIFAGHWAAAISDEHIEKIVNACLEHKTTRLNASNNNAHNESSLSNDTFTYSHVFAASMYKLNTRLAAHNVELGFHDLGHEFNALFKVATAVAPLTTTANKSSFIKELQAGITSFGAALIEIITFVGQLMVALLRFFKGQSQARWHDFFAVCLDTGPRALAIITLTSTLVGVILAYLGLVQLQSFGAEAYIADLVAIGMLREMASLITAIVMAGRTGAAFAAQIGTMKVREEIDALTTLGMNVFEYLILPRTLALFCMMPLLVIYASFFGILGGLIIVQGMDVSALLYFDRIVQAASFHHFIIGIIKSFVFALLIAISGCQAGLNCGRDAAAVGEATTKAVVSALIYLIIADAAINIIDSMIARA